MAFASTYHEAFGYNDRNELTESLHKDAAFGLGTVDPNMSHTYVYDPFGSAVTGITAMAAALTYDEENRLQSYTPTIRVDGSERVEFKYDYLGRRFEKTVYTYTSRAWGATPSSQTRYLYDGWRVVAEMDALSSNAILRRYTWGLDLSRTLDGAGGIGGLLAVEEITGSDAGSYVYTYDHLGNVGQLVEWADLGGLIGNDWDGSRLAAKYEYDPYGNITGPDSDSDGVADAYDVDSYASTNPMRFSTKAWGNETGFGYWGYRYYSPELGRWLNRDPIEERGGTNLFTFNLNLPASRIDYLGRTSKRCGGPVHDKIKKCVDERDKCNESCYDDYIALPSNGVQDPDAWDQCTKGCGRDLTSCVLSNSPKGTFTPLPSNSPRCNDYCPDDQYTNAYARCFCKCAGDSKWSNYVRGCLNELYHAGVCANEAHRACYETADFKSGDRARPIGRLFLCLIRCWDYNPQSP